MISIQILRDNEKKWQDYSHREGYVDIWGHFDPECGLSNLICIVADKCVLLILLDSSIFSAPDNYTQQRIDMMQEKYKFALHTIKKYTDDLSYEQNIF